MARGVQIGKQTARKLLQLARERKGLSLPGMGDRFREAPGETVDTITVYNATGADLDEFAVVELDGTVLNAADLDLPADAKNAIYNGLKPEDGYTTITPTTLLPVYSKRIAIVQEAIPSGQVGQAKISGITPVQINTQTGWREPLAAHVSPGQTDYLDGNYRAAQYGFPILWREPGNGIKWGLIDLKHFDGPSYYFIRNPIGYNATFSVPVASRTVYSSSTIITGGSQSWSKIWRWPGSPGADQTTVATISTANYMRDLAGDGLRYDGHAMMLGTYTGRVVITYPISIVNNKPVIDSARAGLSQSKPVFQLVAGNSVPLCIGHKSAVWQPLWREVPAPYTPLFEWPVIQEAFTFALTFFVRFQNPFNSTSAIAFSLSLALQAGSERFSSSFGSITAPNNPSSMLQVQFLENSLSLVEVNPGWQSFAGSTFGPPIPGGGVVAPLTQVNGASPNPEPSTSTLKTATVLAYPSKTLTAPFGGTAAAPIP
jgi:hypothetical protein